MAKLYYRYGAMNCGKSSLLMQVAHNYNENDKKVIVIKSIIDTKGDDCLSSRIGLKRKVDILLDRNQSIEEYYDKFDNISCILVDEAQFLTSKQVEELWIVSKLLDISVICYGLRTNFKTESFDGSRRLFELADEIEELTTICNCGNKAKFNGRFINNRFQLDGEEVLIDGSQDNVEYKPLCGICYIKNKKMI